jgi:hypothetical protein
MPLICYLCECKKSVNKFFRQAKDAPAFFICPNCNKDTLKKQLRSPTSKSIIEVDNGVQAKRAEINMETIESIEERSTKDYRNEE